MLIKPYKNLEEISDETLELCDEVSEILIPTLRKNYGNSSQTEFYGVEVIYNQLSVILDLVSTDLKDKIIIDLGCGLSNASDEGAFCSSESHKYEPWLSRILYHMGAYPVGVDNGDLSNERFEHISVDLMAKNSLDFISELDVDIVHTNGLFFSPTSRFLSGYETKDFKDFIISELEVRLKPGTPFVFND